MNITIYTTEGCIWCSRMKELMDRANQTYEEIVYSKLSGDDQVKLLQELTDKGYTDISSFPFAVIDDEFIGGLVPVAKLFLQKGLVSSPQK